MRRYILSFVMLLVLLSGVFQISASAVDDVKIYINGEYLDCDAPAFIENGRTMVPARSIFERLGASVGWNNKESSVTAIKGDVTVKIYIGNNTISVNGEGVLLAVAPTVVNGTTYVPARAVSAALGANVKWNAEKRIVNITTDGVSTLDAFPAVLLPSESKGNAVITLIGKDTVKCEYIFPENENDAIAYGFTELFAELERNMCNVGWKKRIPQDSPMLLESVFYDNTKSDCPYEVRVLVNKPSVGKYELFLFVTEYIIVYNVQNGEVRYITESEYLLNSEYRRADVWKKSLGENITVYDAVNNPTIVKDYELYGYLSSGMTLEMKKVTMYTEDNKEISVGVHLVDTYISLGFSLETRVKMYYPDGKCEYVLRSAVYERVLSGWSTEPFTVVLYSHNGKTTEVKAHEKNEYLAGGWYEEPPIAIYSPGGEKIYVPESQKEVYIFCGWTLAPVNVQDESDEDLLNSQTIVYITSNGTKYHLKPACAGSGAVAVTYGEINGLYQPCGTCSGR